MKGGLLFTVLFFSAITLQAQSLQILDLSETPIPFVHVSCTDVSGKEFIMISNEEGAVTLPQNLITSSEINIIITHISYTTYSNSLLLDKKTIILLAPSDILLNQVVVTAQIAPGNVEKAVQKIKIIDRKNIEAQGAVTLKNILEQENNMRLSQDNILGSSVSVQGVSGQNVKILIDGVPVIGRLNGNIDVSQINLNNIERIEIVEGPLSVNYGTDALAGTINLISKKTESSRINLNSYYETVGKYNLDGVFSFPLNNHRLTFAGGRNYFDGWSASDNFRLIPTVTLADTNRFKNWKPREQYYAKSTHLFSKKTWSIRSYAEYFFENILNRGFPRMPYYETAFDDIYNTNRNNYGIDFHTKINNFNINFIAAYSDYKRVKNTYYIDLTSLDQVLSENPADQDTAKFNSLINRGSIGGEITSNTSLELGYDLKYDEAAGKRILNLNQTQGDYALYSNLEYSPIENLTIRQGLRWAYNTDFDAPLIPSTHIKYRYKNFSLRSSYARGFRAPSLKELYFEFVDINHNIVGNPNLLAEGSNNYQLSLAWKKVRSSSIIRWDASSFYNAMSQLITLANIDDVSYSYINIGEYKTLGTSSNVGLTYEFLKINSGISYIGRQSNISDDAGVHTFDFAVEFKSNLTYNFEKQNSQIALFYKNTGETPSFWINGEGEVEEVIIEGYQMMDLTYSWSSNNERLKLTLGCKNLFDVQDIISTASGSSSTGHQSASSGISVGYGRSFFTSLKWNLNE